MKMTAGDLTNCCIRVALRQFFHTSTRRRYSASHPPRERPAQPVSWRCRDHGSLDERFCPHRECGHPSRCKKSTAEEILSHSERQDRATVLSESLRMG